MQNLDRLSARGKVSAATAAAFLMLSIASPAMADSVRWRTIVGIVQAGNTVGNITGGGQPWTAVGGRARVAFARSRLAFDGPGLVLGGGHTLGKPAAVYEVLGTMLCDAGGPQLT